MMRPELVKIRYSKAISEGKVETTNRTVLITQTPRMGILDQPTENIKAIDLTSSEEGEQQEIKTAYCEYVEYLNAHMKLAFSFEDWLSHTKGVDFTPKWRTFKPEQTDFLV